MSPSGRGSSSYIRRRRWSRCSTQSTSSLLSITRQPRPHSRSLEQRHDYSISLLSSDRDWLPRYEQQNSELRERDLGQQENGPLYNRIGTVYGHMGIGLGGGTRSLSGDLSA